MTAHLYETAHQSGEKIFAVAPMIDWTCHPKIL
jgi:hypothetical protein